MSGANGKKKRFHVCIDEELYAKLGAASRELGVSQSVIVVQALRSWLRGRGNRRRFLDNGGSSVKEL